MEVSAVFRLVSSAVLKSSNLSLPKLLHLSVEIFPVLPRPGNSRCPLNRIRFQSVVCPPAWLVSSAPSSFYETLSEPLANGGGPHGWPVLVFTTAVPRGHPAGAGGNTQGRCHRQADCYLPGFGYSTAERNGLWCQTDQSSNPRPVVDHLCDLRQSTQSSLNSSFRFSKN